MTVQSALDTASVEHIALSDEPSVTERPPMPTLPGLPQAMAVLQNLELFRGLPPELIASLLANVEVLAVPAQTILLRQGDPADDLYLVLTGSVKVSRTSRDDRQAIIEIMGPGDPLGELSAFDGGPRIATVTTLSDAWVAALPKADLHRCVLQSPELALRLLHAAARRLRKGAEDVDSLVFSDVPARLSGHLLRLERKFGKRCGEVIRVDHNLSQFELAQLVGATRETVNKALADFSRRGWIRLDGKSFVILDRQRFIQRSR